MWVNAVVQKCNFHFLEFAMEQNNNKLIINILFITVLYFPHNCTLFSIQHPCYFMENKAHFVPLIRPRKVQYIIKALPLLVCLKNIELGGVSSQIQYSVLPHAVFVSRHASSCCIFHTDAWRCFNIYLLVNRQNTIIYSS